MKKLGLRGQIISATVVLLVVIFGIVGSFGYISLRSMFTGEADKQLTAKTDYCREYTRNYLIERETVLNTEVNATQIDFRNAIKQGKTVEAVRKDLKLHLTNMVKENKAQHGIIDLYIGYQDGSVDDGVGRKYDENWKANKCQWYMAAAAEPDRLIYNNVFINPETKGTAITISHAITDDSGAVIAVAAMEIELDSLRSLFDSVKIGNSGYAFLLEGQGRFVVHKKYKYNEDTSKADTIFNIDKGSLTEAGRILLNGTHKVVSGRFEGVNRMYCSELVDGTNLYIVTTITEEEYLNNLDTLFVKLFAIMAGALLLFIVVIFILIRRITGPLLKIVHKMHILASGDFSGEYRALNRKDEIGVLSLAVESMHNQIKGLIAGIKGMVDAANESSNTLTMSTEQSAKGMEQVATSITNIAIDLNEAKQDIDNALPAVKSIGEVIRDTVGISNKTQENILQTVDITNNGRSSAVGTMSKAIMDTEETVKMVIEASTALTESNAEIQGLVKMVRDIADKINLLALNAQIEAARAGEMGKGFAVVANEMRELSEGTKDAVGEIADILRKTGANISRVVSASEKQKEMVSSFENVSASVSETLDVILGEVNKTRYDMSSIVSEVQSLGIQEAKLVEFLDLVSRFTDKASNEIESISAVVEQQTATMQEITSSSEELNDTMQSLDQQSRSFKL